MGVFKLSKMGVLQRLRLDDDQSGLVALAESIAYRPREFSHPIGLAQQFEGGSNAAIHPDKILGIA